jgi:hypothetical protein
MESICQGWASSTKWAIAGQHQRSNENVDHEFGTCSSRGIRHLVSTQFCFGKFRVLLLNREGSFTETIFSEGFPELTEWYRRRAVAGLCHKWVWKIAVASPESCIATFPLSEIGKEGDSERRQT